MTQQFDDNLLPIEDGLRGIETSVITLPVGKRLRLEGASYEVTSETDVPANLAEVVAQKNRHFKVTCFNPTCVTARKELHRRPLNYRASRETFEAGLPTCGACGGTYPDGSTHTMEPDGWKLGEVAPD